MNIVWFSALGTLFMIVFFVCFMIDQAVNLPIISTIAGTGLLLPTGLFMIFLYRNPITAFIIGIAGLVFLLSTGVSLIGVI